MADPTQNDTAATAPAGVTAQAWYDQNRAQGANIFALIDGPTELDAPLPRIWRPTGGPDEINLFAARTGQARALAIAPRLCELADDAPATMHLLQAVQTQSAEQPRCILIASPLSLEPLAVRLTRRIDVNADGDDMMLRFWDSRIFLSLHRHINPATRDRMMAFGMQALASDRRGGFISLALTCPEIDPLQADQGRLEKDDLTALGLAARPDAVLGMLRQQAPEALAAMADGDRHALAAQQIDQCLQHGFKSPRDHALALSLAIEHGPDWWQHEEWTVCVQQARQGTLLKAYLQHLEAA